MLDWVDWNITDMAKELLGIDSSWVVLEGSLEGEGTRLGSIGPARW